MAKKTKRGRRVRLSPAQMVQPGTGEMADAPLVVAPTRPTLEMSDLREEYHYVIADLKRIGIIAVAMLAVLVVLALLLT
jgi:hypothetical protein